MSDNKTIIFCGFAENVLTQDQVNNLRRLAAYLNALPIDYAKFRMDTFFGIGGINSGWDSQVNGAAEKINDCGTVACACGHGPAAGILPQEGETWGTYERRAFGLDGNTFEWAFGEGWSGTDNTPQGAAIRITMMLDREEVPSDFIDGDGDYEYEYETDLYTEVTIPTLKDLGFT